MVHRWGSRLARALPLLERGIADGSLAMLPMDVPVQGTPWELRKLTGKLRVAGTLGTGLLKLLLLSIRERHTDTARTMAGGELTHERPQLDKVSKPLDAEQLGCQEKSPRHSSLFLTGVA
jgi:hypothetical protein